MKRTIQSCIYFFSFFFVYIYIKKKKVVTPHHLPKKRGALKSTQKISFFERQLSRSFIVVTPLGMLNAKLCIRLK